jgi:hypothetical protein
VEELLVQARALVDEVVVVEADADVLPVEPGIAPLLVLVEAQVVGEGDLPAPGRSVLDTAGVARADGRSPPGSARGTVGPAALIIFQPSRLFSAGIPPFRDAERKYSMNEIRA